MVRELKYCILILVLMMSFNGCSKNGDNALITPTEAVISEAVDSSEEDAHETVAQITSYIEEDSKEVTENTDSEVIDPSDSTNSSDDDTEQSQDEKKEAQITPTEAVSQAVTPVPTATTAAKNKSVEKTMYSTIGLNIREGAGTNYNVVGEIDKGEEVYVSTILENKWAQIKYNGVEGYVYSDYLSDSKPAISTPIPVATATPIPTKAQTAQKNSVVPITPSPTPSSQSGSDTKKYSNISAVSILSKSHDIHTYSSEMDSYGLQLYNDNSDVVSDHLNAVNALRESLGLSKLTLDPTLCRVAAYRTAELIENDFFSHYHPGYAEDNNSACAFDVIYFFQDGYRYIAENLANQKGKWQYFYDRTQLGQIFCDQFADSQAHYDNMVNEKYTKIGICFYIDNGYIEVTQIFG